MLPCMCPLTVEQASCRLFVLCVPLSLCLSSRLSTCQLALCERSYLYFRGRVCVSMLVNQSKLAVIFSGGELACEEFIYESAADMLRELYVNGYLTMCDYVKNC